MLKKILLNPFLIHSVRNYRNRIDPGIHFRKTAMKEAEKDYDFADDDLEDLETDFMDVHQSHKEYTKDIMNAKEKLKYQIVKQKYFKRKLPNFLMWNEKQQIRYLYSTDPEEWTISRLSESFPALPEVIVKIINGKFTKKQSQIENHDATVQKNWLAFQKGELQNLPEKLIEHLKGFSDRSKNFTPVTIPDKTEAIQRPIIPTEFLDIITSYDKLKGKGTDDKTDETSGNTVHNTELSPEVVMNTDDNNENLDQHKRKRVTLQELRDQIKNKAIVGKEIPIEDKIILDHSTDKGVKPEVIKLQSEEINSIVTQKKYHTGEVVVKKTERDYNHLMYPEKIKIPKAHLKHGYTYKLNDCYYDSDGTFLYRVPGMC